MTDEVLAVLRGTQLMPSMVGVMHPFNRAGSRTSTEHAPRLRRSATRLPMPWKLNPFPPGKYPEKMTYSQSSRSGAVQPMKLSHSELAAAVPPQEELW